MKMCLVVVLAVGLTGVESFAHGRRGRGGGHGGGQHGGSDPNQCATPTWHTVDDFAGPQDTEAYATSIAGDGDGVYVGGTISAGIDSNSWVVRRRSPSGQWSTVDNYQPADGSSAAVLGLATRSGDVYAVGSIITPSGNPWVVRRSRNDGATWSEVDRIGNSASARGIVAVPNGPLLVTGVTAAGSEYHWLTRSAEAGTFITSEEVLPSYVATGASAIAANRSGTGVFAVGYDFVDYQYQWVVRRLVNGTWVEVDNFSPNPGDSFGAQPASVAVFDNGTVLVAGTYVPQGQLPRWLIRRSSNWGATWTTSSELIDCRASSIAISANENEVLAVGRCPVDGVDKWVVHRSLNRGQSFQQVDAFTLADDESAHATAVKFVDGVPYVAGFAFDGGQRRWVVRARFCADDDDDDDDCDHGGHHGGSHGHGHHGHCNHGHGHRHCRH